jgi:aminoglycoside phosphotransferase (APT) family kinase protein
VASHGDFTPWNLRDRRSAVPALLDWESVRFAPPGADLVLYIASARAIGRNTRSPERTLTDEARAFWIGKVEERIEAAEQAGHVADPLNTRILEILAEDRTGDAP